MSKFSISEAARLACISRQQLYRGHIKPGKISVIKESGKPFIELSELLRVFPGIKLGTDSETSILHVATQNQSILEPNNNELIKLLKQQIEEANKREEWLMGQIDELRKQQNNLLEDKSVNTRKKIFGIF